MDIKIINKIIKIFFLIIIFFCIYLEGEIYTFFCDLGIRRGSGIYVWAEYDPQNNVRIEGKNSDFSYNVPEGTTCLKTTFGYGSYAGWGIFYTTSSRNFYDYINGDLRFWIRVNTFSSDTSIKVSLEDWDGDKVEKSIIGYGFSGSVDVGKWKLIKIPIRDFTSINDKFNLEKIKSPFTITYTGGSGTRIFYVDYIRWTKNLPSASYLDLKIKDNQTHVIKSSFTFSTIPNNLVNLPQNWLPANEYIELELDLDVVNWGIQIYTDNKNLAAYPRYTGEKNPCGLIDVNNTNFVLPLAWTIEDSTKTFTELGSGEPGKWVSRGGVWKWMKDKNTEGFKNGEYYITVWSNNGILWGDQETPVYQREWRNTPNYIYLSANFSLAVGDRTYTTNQLKIELFYK